MPDTSEIGRDMYSLAAELFPINRSLTGQGVRDTLSIVKRELPELRLHQVPTGTRACDWTVPDEWNISEAYIENEEGKRILDFREHSLHVLGYSEPVDSWFDLRQLQDHLYSLPEQPDAIPYITSYYKRRWGFCMTHNQRQSLAEGKYRAFIDSSLGPGVLDFADLLIKGRSQEEILFSTYICHPSMANNEVSGIVLAVFLAKFLMRQQPLNYSYRFVFVPETIGSIVYISQNLEKLKKNVKAGFVLTCVGDDNNCSFIPSRLGGTLADRVALHVLNHHAKNVRRYTFLDRGSDERQYCSPGVDLPVVSMPRSKYGDYPEYHTSLDNMDFVSPEGFHGAFDIHTKCILVLENNFFYRVQTLCEPQLGKRGLYPTISTKKFNPDVRNMMNLIAYSDGRHDLLDIAETIGADAVSLLPLLEKLMKANLVKSVRHPDVSQGRRID